MDLRSLSRTPAALEALYREQPDAFRPALAEALRAAPDDLVLQAWRARLDLDVPAPAATATAPTVSKDLARERLWTALGIGIIAGAIVRFSLLWAEESWFVPRFVPTIVILAVASYFAAIRNDRRLFGFGAALALVALSYASFLPGETPSVIMALVHIPLLGWALLGRAFAGDGWRETEPRIAFVRYHGELLVLGALVGLGGAVFSGLTVGLFSMISKQAAKYYFENIGVVGMIAAPTFATWLYDSVFNRRTGIASVLARAFAPFFLVMTSLYLVLAFTAGQNPFLDRAFLITFNGLLLIVLGMTLFSIAERPVGDGKAWTDYVNVALIGVTLVIDAIALAAIVFRLTAYGWSPNRVVVFGANLVIMGHLLTMGRATLAMVRGTGDAAAQRASVARYLPIYAIWATIVVIGVPLLFQFK